MIEIRKVNSIQFHRNGIGGSGFIAVDFETHDGLRLIAIVDLRPAQYKDDDYVRWIAAWLIRRDISIQGFFEKLLAEYTKQANEQIKRVNKAREQAR